MKSHDVALWKEAINDEMDSIMGNNTWVLADLPLGCKPLGCKWIFKRKLKVDGTIEKRISIIRLLIALESIHNLIIHHMDVKTTFLNGEFDEEVYINQPRRFIIPGNEDKVELTKELLSSRFSMKDMEEDDVILVSTPMNTSEKLMPNNGQTISQLIFLSNSEGTKVFEGTIYYSLKYTSYPSVLEGYTYASWISNIEDNSSTSAWVFLLDRGAISWASKKQTCITSSTMKYKYVALAAAGKEAEWLRNLILEIPLWSKPITSISICCDSVATLAKAYSQMLQWKSNRSVRHSMIRELIMNRVVSIDFVRS
ncbi:zinc finger, CCHC-type containing protein [Tanacetum coccineum]